MAIQIYVACTTQIGYTWGPCSPYRVDWQLSPPAAIGLIVVVTFLSSRVRAVWDWRTEFTLSFCCRCHHASSFWAVFYKQLQLCGLNWAFYYNSSSGQANKYIIWVCLWPWMHYFSLWWTFAQIRTRTADIQQNGPWCRFHNIHCMLFNMLVINTKVTYVFVLSYVLEIASKRFYKHVFLSNFIILIH